MIYYKQSDDKQYRVVNITRTGTGEFIDFTADKVNYPEGCVIEVRKTDGTTNIHYEHARQRVNVGIHDQCLFIPAYIPTARLWVREKGDPVMHYKVPSELKIDKNTNVALILIPGGPQKVELVGDPYFDAVYEL